MNGQNFIGGRWVEGLGAELTSTNPANGEVIWHGFCADADQIHRAIHTAKNAFLEWSSLSLENRIEHLERFNKILEKNKALLTTTLSKEIGKPLWESETEIDAMIKKLPISIEAYHQRCQEREQKTPTGISITRHKPYGVMGVLGPFNFPGHLPNGHIMPALLAGNTIVFKASELAPLFSQTVFACWEEAALPLGVINLIQGKKEAGELLANHNDINGLMFTGSFNTGIKLARLFSEKPEKILALEMGGNNPLVVHQVHDIKAAALQVILSAYITAGQRCTCARRLILTRDWDAKAFLDVLVKMVQSLKVGPYTDNPQPFLGPVINNVAANHIITAYELLVNEGAKPLVPLQRVTPDLPFLSPGLLDLTSLKVHMDEEIFGPLLQLIWVDNLKAAIAEANKTVYGLSAGLLSDNAFAYTEFLKNAKAGVINWNKPLTGASSLAPFGGIGHSGNHRPSAYYAADYCAYPVASLEDNHLKMPDSIPPGILS